MKNFEEYHDLYLKTDILLLADVFMNYTIMCLKDDGLDSFHYISVLEIFNNFLYKNNEVKLKLMIDMDEYLIVKNSIYRSMIIVSHQYAKANNLQCSNYKFNKSNSWIIYENMNVLYLGIMT